MFLRGFQEIYRKFRRKLHLKTSDYIFHKFLQNFHRTYTEVLPEIPRIMPKEDAQGFYFSESCQEKSVRNSSLNFLGRFSRKTFGISFGNFIWKLLSEHFPEFCLKIHKKTWIPPRVPLSIPLKVRPKTPSKGSYANNLKSFSEFCLQICPQDFKEILKSILNDSLGNSFHGLFEKWLDNFLWKFTIKQC